jgi:hypothetical protein
MNGQPRRIMSNAALNARGMTGMLKSKVYCKDCKHKRSIWSNSNSNTGCDYIISSKEESEYYMTDGDPIDPPKRKKRWFRKKKVEYANPYRDNKHNDCKYYEEK